MSLRRMWALCLARNREFLRDRAGLAWNLLFPFLMVGALGFILADRGDSVVTVGVVSSRETASLAALRALEHVRFVEFENRDAALDQLRRQGVDLVVSAPAGEGSPIYWVDPGTPRGYIAERLLIGASQAQAGWIRQSVSVEALPYGAWLFPGLLALNLMWMSLYGVGWSIVRARHSGVLRRFRVTSATAAEFLLAQILSRVLLMTFTGAVVYAGCVLVYGFTCRGSLPALALTLLAGTLSATALGLLTASRSESPELVSAILNFVAPVMMLLGGVWFPLNRVPDWVSTLAHALPVTRCVEAARAIMNEGASLADVSSHLTFLTVFTGCCLGLGAALFRWHRDD